MNQDLLTLRETAKRLNVKPVRAAELVRQGVLPAVRLGRQIRIDPRKLDNFIEGGGRALQGGWRRSEGPTSDAVRSKHL